MLYVDVSEHSVRFLTSRRVMWTYRAHEQQVMHGGYMYICPYMAGVEQKVKCGMGEWRQWRRTQGALCCDVNKTSGLITANKATGEARRVRLSRSNSPENVYRVFTFLQMLCKQQVLSAFYVPGRHDADQRLAWQCTYIHNIIARSCYHICSREAIRITYSECVSVALAIRHAKRVRPIMWPLFQYCLINGKDFRDKNYGT